MKKILIILLIAFIFVSSFLTHIFTDMNVKYQYASIPDNGTIMIERIYLNWDEAKDAGEYIVDKKHGLFKFRSASRIDNTEKFKVIYANN